MRSGLLIVVVTAVLVALVPAAAVAAPARIVATTPILGAVVRELVGDAARVEVLMPAGGDPHEFRASARDAVRLRTADLIVMNGRGLDGSLSGAVDRAREGGVPVVVATDHVTAPPEDHRDDPHFWTDPLQVSALVDPLARAIGDVTGTDTTSAARGLRERLARLDSELRAVARTVPPARRVLVTGHVSMAYFARAYGFRLVGEIVPSVSSQAAVSAEGLARLRREIARERVPAVFTEQGTPAAVARAIGAEAGVPVVSLPTHTLPADGSYDGYMRRLMRTVVDGLTGSPVPRPSRVTVAPAPLAPLTDPFLRRALVAGVLVAVAAAVVGTFIVLRGLAFIGDALAHGVLPGVAGAVLLGLPTLLGAAVGATVMIGGVTLVTRRSRLTGDTAIGLLFVGMLALGVVMVSRPGAATGDLTAILFGDILGIGWGDIAIQVAATVAVVVVAGLCARPFMLLCIDPDHATTAGFPAARYHALMLALIAATVVVCFQTVGTLLVFGMLVAPPATAALVSTRVPAMMALAATLGAASVWIGLAASYAFELAAGATIVMVQVIVFFAVLAGRAGVVRRAPAPA